MAASTARSSTNLRLYILAGVFVLWCGVISVRLVYLQIFRYGAFEHRAQHQQQRTEEVSARRGIIYDRAGPRTGHVDQRGFGIRGPDRNAEAGQHHLSDRPHHQAGSARTAGKVRSGENFLLAGAQSRIQKFPRAFGRSICAAFISRKSQNATIRKMSWPRRCSAMWAWTIPA